MVDRPLGFSGPMVLALIEGRKTMTRRVIASGVDGSAPPRPPLISFGDRLWVREAISAWLSGGVSKYSRYDADGKATFFPWPKRWTRDKAPAMYMPRAMSRLTLTVTDVRMQRLQEISGSDANAEGIQYRQMDVFGMDRVERQHFYKACFEQLWNSINADRGYGWSTNPFIVAYTFTVHKSNIDNLKGDAA